MECYFTKIHHASTWFYFTTISININENKSLLPYPKTLSESKVFTCDKNIVIIQEIYMEGYDTVL